MLKITKSLNNNYVLSLRDAYGTKAIRRIATPEELIEAREWVEKFYEGDYKIQALEDLKKDKVLKYKNGAVVHAHEYCTDYWYVDNDNIIEKYEWENDFLDKARLSNKNVFLTYEEAEAYSKRREIYNSLEKQITIINAENNWVADWSDRNQEKYCLNLNNHNNVYYYSCSWRHQRGAYYMCKEAVDWLLSDKVTDEQRKIWIEGV